MYILVSFEVDDLITPALEWAARLTRISRADERIYDTRYGNECAFCLESFSIGLKLPFHDFIIELLNAMEITPMQNSHLHLLVALTCPNILAIRGYVGDKRSLPKDGAPKKMKKKIQNVPLIAKETSLQDENETSSHQIIHAPEKYTLIISHVNDDTQYNHNSMIGSLPSSTRVDTEDPHLDLMESSSLALGAFPKCETCLCVHSSQVNPSLDDSNYTQVMDASHVTRSCELDACVSAAKDTKLQLECALKKIVNLENKATWIKDITSNLPRKCFEETMSNVFPSPEFEALVEYLTVQGGTNVWYFARQEATNPNSPYQKAAQASLPYIEAMMKRHDLEIYYEERNQPKMEFQDNWVSYPNIEDVDSSEE
ncbi:hypothetical protein ACFE04_021020 [Oxalis oulophora]